MGCSCSAKNVKDVKRRNSEIQQKYSEAKQPEYSSAPKRQSTKKRVVYK